MVNFANLTKPGVIPAVPERFRVKGIRRKNVGMVNNETQYGEPFAVRCEIELVHFPKNEVAPERDVLVMKEGCITGFESMVLDERCLKELGTRPWCANAGGMGWDELTIDQENMAALREWIDRKLAEPKAMRELLEAFLRAPSIGSSGPGSVTIEVQSRYLRDGHKLLEKK